MNIRRATARVMWGVVVAGGVVGSSLVLRAQDSIVKTRDNATFQGTVSENNGNVIVRSHGGVETTIPRTEVLSIDRVGTYADEFHAKYGKLDPKDVPGRLTLARDAFEHRQYDIARTAAEDALSIDPNNREASDLIGLIQTQLRLERAKQDGPPVDTAPTTRPQMAAQMNADRRLLTAADIEAIRRAELQPSDTTVRIRFDNNDVKRRFAETQNVSFAEFAALQPVEQALLILDRGDESMRDKVHIQTDPQSIVEYRRQIQPLIVQNCATIGCHGGNPNAGLTLLTNGENDAVTYTNFYILQSYRKRIDSGTGVFAGSMKRLIMRGHGEQSLLANYGLPPHIAEYDHPLVNNKPITAIFRNKLDARYQMVVDWMNVSLKNVGEPNYGIRYSAPNAAQQQPAPPAAPVTDQPAAQ